MKNTLCVLVGLLLIGLFIVLFQPEGRLSDSSSSVELSRAGLLSIGSSIQPLVYGF